MSQDKNNNVVDFLKYKKGQSLKSFMNTPSVFEILEEELTEEELSMFQLQIHEDIELLDNTVLFLELALCYTNDNYTEQERALIYGQDTTKVFNNTFYPSYFGRDFTSDESIFFRFSDYHEEDYSS